MTTLFKNNRYSVLISGICALILSMGIARYSFTPMIPNMQEQLGLSESLAGWLAGWNYVGYLAGLFIVWLIKDLRAKDFFYRYGLVVSVLATALMAAHEHALVWYVSRFFAGISTATGLMLGTGLILNWLHHHNHKSELGTHFAGVGLGIAVCAFIVDSTGFGTAFDLGWRLQWVALAVVGVVLAIPAMLLLPMPTQFEKEMSRDEDIGQGETTIIPSARFFLFLQIAYVCAGFSNTMNVTFTSLITELQPLEGLGAKMWLVVGLAAVPAPILWDRLARKIGRVDALLIAFTLNAMGNVCLALTTSTTTTVIAAVLFGLTFMGIVSLTLSTIGHAYGKHATRVMARLTLGYCVAQIISPIMTGVIAEQTGSFSTPLYVISAIMILGLISLFLIRHEKIQE